MELAILIVILGLIFDYTNGFHDAANSIATVVSTGVLKPGQAVLFAAFFKLPSSLFYLPLSARLFGIYSLGFIAFRAALLMP